MSLETRLGSEQSRHMSQESISGKVDFGNSYGKAGANDGDSWLNGGPDVCVDGRPYGSRSWLEGETIYNRFQK